MTRWDGESYEGVYERCGTGTQANGVVEWVKRNTLRRFGHMERIESEAFVKKVSVQTVQASTRKHTNRATKRIFRHQDKTILGPPPSPILQIMILKLSPLWCLAGILFINLSCLW